MITDKEQPVWFDYLYIDDDLNQRLREDAPEGVKSAYEMHLKEVSAMSRNGQYIDKA